MAHLVSLVHRDDKIGGIGKTTIVTRRTIWSYGPLVCLVYLLLQDDKIGGIGKTTK